MSLKLDNGAKHRQSAPRYIVVVTDADGFSTTDLFWDADKVYDTMVDHVTDRTKDGASAHVFTRHWVVAEKVGLDWQAPGDG